MKWVKTDNDLHAEDVDKKDKRQISAFKVYDSPTELNADLQNEKKFVKWISYPIEDKPDTEYTDVEKKAISLYTKKVVIEPLPDFKNRKALRRFEVFCGGFLFYHDVIIKRYHKGRGYRDVDGILKLEDYPEQAKDKEGNVTLLDGFGHNIYFDWLPVGPATKKDRVIIYINPTPPEFNPNPPPPPPPPPPESNG